MKKIKVNYVKNYNEKIAFENLKSFFAAAKNYVEKIEHEKQINLNFNIDLEKITLNEKIKSFLQIEFLLEKKAIAFLFKNYIQQIKDKSEFDLSVKIQYTPKSLKTLKKLFNIFTEEKAFFEIKKSELNDFLISKFNKTVEKTANLTIDNNFTIPEFINQKTFISAHLITEAAEKTVKITNKFKDLQDFIK